MNSQEEVTPQMAFPPDTNKTKTLKKRCHASDVATKKPANEVELMSYLIYGGYVSFVFTVSVRFNGVSVRALKQSIVPCKLLILANGMAVFVGSNITDATPIFSTLQW